MEGVVEMYTGFAQRPPCIGSENCHKIGGLGSKMKLCRCGRVVKDRCLVCNPPRKHTGTTKDRGYSNDHRKASENYRTLHPLCECCIKKVGVLHANGSEEMHHIESIADNPTKRMDRGNWLAVCRPCHEELEGDKISGMVVKRWSEQHYEDALNGQG